jgi:LacI family transcriptional regulator
MPTIKDIAREANVSVTTVSNVIHGKRSRVAKETIERVEKIIAANNYTPNMSARALVNKSSRIIAVINHLIQSQSISFLQDPFHGALVGGVERKLRERGYYMMIRTVADEEELFSLFRNWNFDGVILTGLFEDSFFARLIESGKPVVLLDSYVKDERVINIGLEDRQGGFIATQHLIDKGHRDIVFASPRIHKGGVIDERFKGYQAALKKNSLPFKKENVYQQEITINEGISLGHTLSERRDVTAVFATADILAAGIITGLTERNRSVPQDMSVVGFDNTVFSRVSNPPLTTIHQDAEEKGSIAAEVMVDCLEKKALPDNRNIILPVSLIERASVSYPGRAFSG